MKRPVLVTTTLDALAMLDSVADSMKCSRPVDAKVKRAPKTIGAAPRNATVHTTCVQRRVPVDERCPECNAAWHIRRAVTTLEGGAA